MERPRDESAPLSVYPSQLKRFERVQLTIHPKLALSISNADPITLDREEDQLIQNKIVALKAEQRTWRAEQLELTAPFFVTLLEPGTYRFKYVNSASKQEILSNEFVVSNDFSPDYFFHAFPGVTGIGAKVKCKFHFPNYHFYQNTNLDSLAFCSDDTNEIVESVALTSLQNKTEWESTIPETGGSYSFRYYYLSPTNELCRSSSVFANSVEISPRSLRPDIKSVRIKWNTSKTDEEDELVMLILKNGGEERLKSWKPTDFATRSITLQREDFPSSGTFVFRYIAAHIPKMQCTLAVLDANRLDTSEEEIVRKSPVRRDRRPPSWMPDFLANHCTKCNATFSVLHRKHHCRCCGRIFCSGCSSRKAALPMFGEKSLATKKQRVCDSCFIDVQLWNVQKFK
eukprot:TRINITY_DN5732_c0_g1_i1.p1 TRINITY_DN5732_c0_g1~~TRINITY_DN5732_c0_g1_i1.p1  ORF type:complete len:400 (-),score=59.90 TRINITY_DN5732_c0_g1_i1:61-1260(-)